MNLSRDLIYEAIVDDDLFAQLPGIVAASVGARSAIMHWRDAGNARVVFGHSGHFTDEHMQLYAEGFADRDPWTDVGLANTNRILACTDFFAPRDYEMTAFYNDWIRAIGDDTYYCMGSVMHTPTGHGVIGLHRGIGQADFDQDDVGRLQPYAGDLRRMFTIRIRNAQLEQRNRLLESLVEGLGDPLLIVNHNGRLRSANPAAAGLLRTGTLVATATGHLRSVGTISTPLDVMIAKATAPTDRAGSDAYIQSVSGEGAQISVTPLPGAPGPACAMVSLRLPQRGSTDGVILATLRLRFELTEAEADVALRLSRGGAIADIALARRSTTGTVRNQAKSIMSKMGVNRQSQIVSAVAALT